MKKQNPNIEIALKFISGIFTLFFVLTFGCSRGEKITTNYTGVNFLGDGVHYAVRESFERYQMGWGFYSNDGKVVERKYTVYVRNINNQESRAVYESHDGIFSMFANLQDTSITLIESTPNKLAVTFKYDGTKVSAFNIGEVSCLGWIVPYKKMVIINNDSCFIKDIETGQLTLIDSAYGGDAQPWGAIYSIDWRDYSVYYPSGQRLKQHFPYTVIGWINKDELFGVISPSIVVRYTFSKDLTDTLYHGGTYGLGSFSINMDGSILIEVLGNNINLMRLK